MRVLVTGDLGFVGRHLCQAIELTGRHELYGIDIKAGKDIKDCPLPEVDLVYHLAAQTDAQSGDAEADARVNILGSLRIFERYGKRVIFASSSMVAYPVSPYAISKAAAESYAAYYGAGVVRFCNLYGEGGHSVIDKFREQDRLTIYGTGEQLRTYAPVAHAVRALLRATCGTVVILEGTDYTVNEIAGMFPGKPVDRAPARRLDPMDARQVAAR